MFGKKMQLNLRQYNFFDFYEVKYVFLFIK